MQKIKEKIEKATNGVWADEGEKGFSQGDNIELYSFFGSTSKSIEVLDLVQDSTSLPYFGITSMITDDNFFQTLRTE